MKTDFIIPHFSAENNPSEILYCLRSIRKNFRDHGNIYVVGDVPPWLGRNGVPLKRYRNGFGCKFTDQQRKLLHCLKTRPVTERFVYINDDVFFVQPVTMDDITVPYKETKPVHNAGNIWKAVLELTFRFAAQNGGTAINYETHMPVVLEKEKAIELLELAGDQPLHIASAYFNLFPSPARELDDSVKRIRYNTGFDRAKIINSCPQTFDRIREQLHYRFTAKSDLEHA